MFGYAVLIALVGAGMQLAAGRPVVRRVAYGSHESDDESSQENQAGMHCVVWGDWAFEGKRFNSKEEAAEFFKQKKRTELAAMQIHGGKQVDRHMSKRLTHVDWTKMKQWCDKHASDPVLAEEATPQFEKAQVHVDDHRPVASTSEDASEHEAANPSPDFGSLFESGQPFERPKKHKSDRLNYHPVIASLVATSTGETTSFEGKASTLSGKASMLKKEFTSLSNKVSGLLKSIGVESKGALLQSNREDSSSKLRSRVGALQDFSTEVQEKTSLVETEMFGSPTSDKSTSSQQGSGRSVKGKVDALAMQADELKSRLSGLESSPLLGEVAKLEEATSSLGSKAERIFTSIGVKGIKAPAKLTASNQPLKTLLVTLEEYVEGVQRNAAKLEYEILENSWNLPTSGDSQKVGQAGSIKDHAASLGDRLHDLESRLSSLGNAPIVTDVSRMEDAVPLLTSRLSALSKNVGDNAKMSQESMALAPQGSALKARMAALGGYIDNMQSTTAALEEELAGNAGTMPTQSRKDTLKSTARFMEQQVENMNARITALEQQL